MDHHASLRLWLETAKQQGMALGLQNTHAALIALNLPEPTFQTIHVAGSNGKGTAVACLCAALTEVNVPCLAFTSPHLVRVEERVRLSGTPVDSDVFDNALATVRAMSETTDISLTFFEITFLVAMVVAHASSIEVLVLETGLGGRLDATRVAPADVCVITALSQEHTTVLGDTLEAISKEKAAIARPGAPLIVRHPMNPTVESAIADEAENAGNPELNERKAPANLLWMRPEPHWTFIEEAQNLMGKVWPYLESVADLEYPEIETLQWPARMQQLVSPSLDGLTYLLEGAHNPSGMLRSCAELPLHLQKMNRPWALLLGSTPQSDMKAMLEPLASLCRMYPPQAVVLSVPEGGRYPGVSLDEMEVHAQAVGIIVTHRFVRPKEAIAAFERGHIVVGHVISIGSLYMQGNVLEALGYDGDEYLRIGAKK